MGILEKKSCRQAGCERFKPVQGSSSFARIPINAGEKQHILQKFTTAA